MKLHEMIVTTMVTEEKIKIKTRTNLADFFIRGYLSFFVSSIQEARLISTDDLVIKIKNKSYKFKVNISKKDLQRIAKKIDSFYDKMPILLDEIRFHSSDNPKRFVGNLIRFFNQMKKLIKREKTLLHLAIEDSWVTKRNLKHFNSLNEQIIQFNSLFDFLEEVFSKKKMDDSLNLAFNDEVSDVHKLLMKTLDQKLPLLDVPDEPILKELKEEEIDLGDLEVFQDK